MNMKLGGSLDFLYCSQKKHIRNAETVHQKLQRSEQLIKMYQNLTFLALQWVKSKNRLDQCVVLGSSESLAMYSTTHTCQTHLWRRAGTEVHGLNTGLQMV